MVGAGFLRSSQYVAASASQSVVDQPACLYVRRSELGLNYLLLLGILRNSLLHLAINNLPLTLHMCCGKNWNMIGLWYSGIQYSKKNGLIKLFGKNILGITPPSECFGFDAGESNHESKSHKRVRSCAWYGMAGICDM